jgi:hypothetical protein
MAEFEPAPVTPPVAAPPVAAPPPDFDALIAAEKARADQAAADLAKKGAQFDERLASLEVILADRYSRKEPPPPVTSPVVSDADFLTPEGARIAATRLAEEKALQVGQALDAQYRGTMTTLLEDQFDAKLESLKHREFYKYIKDDLDKAIKANPKLKLAPKALDILYNAMVGDKSVEIVNAEAEARRGAPPPVVGRPDPGSTRAGMPSAYTPPVDTSKEVVLTEAEELTRQKFYALGVKLSPEDWAARRDALNGRSTLPGAHISTERR